jgi:cysteine sulfinate desulfinase/cysteine desulfurase-like protein
MSIRFSFGRQSTQDDINFAVEVLASTIIAEMPESVACASRLS